MSTDRRRIERESIRRVYNILLVICVGTLMVFLIIFGFGSAFACNMIDGSAFRAAIKVEDHWGNFRNPEIYFNDGRYTWVTGGDVVLMGSYECVAGRIITPDGWTSQLSAGGTALTLDGNVYRRVILRFNNLK